MKKLATSLLVWILLLALPFQAVAAAAMLPCAVVNQTEHHAADHSAASHHGSGVVHHNTHKAHAGCGSCTACSPAVIGTAALLPLSDRAPTCDPRAFVPGFLASVDLAMPERPPCTLPLA